MRDREGRQWKLLLAGYGEKAALLEAVLSRRIECDTRYLFDVITR